jgi:hypothetical protein
LTGTITFKIAPLGWEKVFSKTNVGVYRSTDPAGTRAYYRVDDANALYSRVTMYESMSDVDTGVAAAPTSPAGGFYWHKRTAAAAAGVYWVLRGDSRGFYLSVAPQAATSPATSGGYGLYTHYAGDLNSYRSGDAWCAVLTGAVSTTYTDLAGCVFTANGVTGGLLLQRMSAGLAGALQVSRAITGNMAATSGNDATLGAYPSRADNGLRLSPIMLSDGVMASFGPRGELPGAYHCPQTGLVGAMGADAFMTQGQGSYSNRRLQSVGSGNVSAAAPGCGFIDITGPWR